MPIISTHDVCGGKPCILGTRITVETMVDMYNAEYADTKGKRNDIRGLRAALKILDDYPKLTLQDIYDCLTHNPNNDD